MNKWLLLILGIVSILLLSYISFKQKATIIREDLINKTDIIHQNSVFKDVYIKLKGEGFALTREIMLLGTVSSKEDKALASNLLQDIEGVTKVNNLLKVQSLKPIIKEVDSIEVNDTINDDEQKVELNTLNEEKNSSLDYNKTQIPIEDNNISKDESENNITEQNSTNQDTIESIETNLTKENNETNQSSCQEQVNDILSKGKIHFANNSSNIKKSSYKQLDQISTILKECPKNSILIDGYSDNRGDAKYNQQLSQQRANKVKTYLISKGIDKKSIKAFGHGAENPIASNETKQGREQNRRIEFTIKKIK